MSDLQDALDWWDAEAQHIGVGMWQGLDTIVDAARRVANPEIIDIVFDGPPGHIAGRFVEVENQDGHSIRVGEWVERDDGYWVLRLALGITEDE